MSRIGRFLVPVPAGVDVTIDGQDVTVKGPKGTLYSAVFGSKIQSLIKPSNADFTFVKDIERLGKIHSKFSCSRI